MIFAAISGSGPATVAALGIIVIPALVKAGYDVGFAAALMATAGAIGVIIPPSITFVVYGSISDTSIGDLFIAGVLPGLVMGAALIAVTFWLGRKKELTRLPKASGKERWKAFKDAFWGLLMRSSSSAASTAACSPRPTPLRSPRSTACSSAWSSTAR